MKIFALADPHLSLNTPNKSHDKFGARWADHPRKIEAGWRATVGGDDLVLVAGDISWAMKMEGAQADLDFLAGLPGTKVIIRGNHDYWWSTPAKVRRAIGPTMRAIQHDALCIGRVAICGTRLWDVPGVGFGRLIDWQVATPKVGELQEKPARPEKPVRDEKAIAAKAAEDEKIYLRELERLRRSLTALEEIAPPDRGFLRIAMLHYPPCDVAMNPTGVTKLLEEHAINHVVFGHVHNLRQDLNPAPFGERNGVHYHLTACDYLDFTPKLIATIDN
ncbi:MAG TPA: metallophosphoesterase [Tepidisphaeraceae bacterium]|jgi:hypothetical protein|nr:metallophosphoesterase [Tepidisphaeraceae bacterium]